MDFVFRLQLALILRNSAADTCVARLALFTAQPYSVLDLSLTTADPPQLHGLGMECGAFPLMSEGKGGKTWGKYHFLFGAFNKVYAASE